MRGYHLEGHVVRRVVQDRMVVSSVDDGCPPTGSHAVGSSGAADGSMARWPSLRSFEERGENGV